MKTKTIVCLVLCCFVGLILAGISYPAQQKQKPRLRYVYEDYAADSPGGTKDCPKSGSHYVPSQAASGGIQYQINCEDIFPSIGTIIQHDQIGSTWYDFQQNGSIGRMISVTNGGYRHFSWMYCDHPYPPGPRYVDANCKNPLGVYFGQTHADGGATNAGYSNQTHLHDGTSVVVYHRTAGTPLWYTALTMADEPGSNSFGRHWDVPDYVSGSTSVGEWPKAEVSYDPVEMKDYMHIVMIEGSTGCSDPYKLPYERCYLGTNDTLICQNYNDGATRTYKMAQNANGPGSFAPVSSFNTSCSHTPVIAVSPVSRRVAMAFFRQADPANTCNYLSDVCFVESISNGDDWIDGNPWPPPFFNLTNYGTGGTERAVNDLSACYDYQDSLHIVYVTAGFDPSDQSYDPSIARLYHWSKKSGISLITSKIQQSANPGSHNLNIAKMSISAANPIDYPERDTVLYAIWTQFDSSDKSVAGWGNGDIYGSVSCTGGATWGYAFNLTNTHTPNCAPGNCLSEHWSSLAQNIYNGDLHIQYICDKDAGGAIQEANSAWLENPVMYLHLSMGTDICHPGVCRIAYQLESPRSSWSDPPLKVTPGGFRDLTLKLFSIGNDVCVYHVTSDNSCIQINTSGSLSPRDSAIVTPVISGSGLCNNTYIEGNIIISVEEPGNPPDTIPVKAVVAEDYYECPLDPLTYDSLANGILQMYVNANGQEWIQDVGSFPDTVHEVFFNGGLFVATTESNDTLVGRYMGDNDQHALAREMLYLNEYTDFWLEYSWNVSIHDLNPPVDTKWWWFEILHENIFFKPTVSDALKHSVIKFVTVERHDPPGWWPSQPTFTGYEDTYIGMMMDIDAPWDTLDSQNGRNWAGYDATNKIAWQRGWDYTGAHPEYNDYYTGIALIQGFQIGESTVPWGTFNLRNDVYLYPQSPWGWRDGEFYQLAKNNVPGTIQDPDSLVDRSQIVTARKIPVGSDLNARASFTVVEVAAPGGVSQLQAYVDSARAWVAGKPIILCGDCNCDGIEDVGDLICKINFLYKGYSAPACGPLARLDCNNSGSVEIGDIITEINYLYKGAPASTIKCPGVW